MAHKKILLVDDEPFVQELIYLKIKALGDFDIVTAANVDEALSLLTTVPFHLIVTDFEMPGKSGLDLISYIKREGLNCQVILFTSYPGFPAHILSEMKNFLGVVEKPEYDHLCQIIRRHYCA